MTFSITWSETSPQGTASANTLDTIIQQLKTAVRERLQFGGMYFPSDDDALAGEHEYVRMTEQSAYPAANSNKGFLLVKDASGVTELHYMDDAGNVTQLTAGGVLNDTVRAKTGDWMLSTVTTARTGWTNVSATYANKFIRIAASGLSTGGADTHTHAGGSLAFAHTHTLTTSLAYAGTTSINVNLAQQDTYTTNSQSASTTTGTTASGDNVPAYVTTVIFQKD